MTECEFVTGGGSTEEKLSISQMHLGIAVDIASRQCASTSRASPQTRRTRSVTYNFLRTLTVE